MTAVTPATTRLPHACDEGPDGEVYWVPLTGRCDNDRGRRGCGSRSEVTLYVRIGDKTHLRELCGRCCAKEVISARHGINSHMAANGRQAPYTAEDVESAVNLAMDPPPASMFGH